MQRIGIFDIVGGYFADVFANAIYFNVKKTSATTKQSINDEYRKLIVSYAQSMHDDDALFDSTMINMCKYYNTVNNKHVIGLTNIEFEDLIINSFIAKEHHQKIKQAHKRQILHNIMFETVNFLVSEILDRPDEVMAKIFAHDVNIGHTLREIATESIKSQKETMANRLIKDNTPKASDMDLITRLKSQINQKINELVQTREDYNKSIILLNAYKSHAESMKSERLAERNELANMKLQLNEAKSQLNEARSQLNETKTELSLLKSNNNPLNDRIASLTKENEDQRRKITEMDNKIRLLAASSPTTHDIRPAMQQHVNNTPVQEDANLTDKNENVNPPTEVDDDNVEQIEFE